MDNLTLTINGEAHNADQTFDVINPATEQVLAKCPQASAEQVDVAVNSAQEAFKGWRALSEQQRGDFLLKAADALSNQLEKIATLLSQEQGKTLGNAVSEVESAISRLQRGSEMRLPIEVQYEDEEMRTELHRKPLGVIAVITPWNYPIHIAAGRMCSALMSGNTVVVKPSPYTPLATLLVGEIFRDIFPAGVVNIVSGGDEVGEVLTKHPLIRKISFTGSVPTGIAIAAVAAKDLKGVTLELGGNDVAIVLDDADIEKIAEPIFWGAFSNTGQICTAIKRLYVHEKVYESLVKKLKELAEQLKIGDGLDPESDLGPLNNKVQLEIVSELVEDAKKRGATILTGGERMDKPGYFYKPTLVTNIQEGIRLVDEEQFGPALPIIKYSNVNDVIKRANNSTMGLGGSVWGGDVERASKVASQLESGIAWVNTIFDMSPNAPFGGVKQSGIGRESGRWGLEELTDLQAVCINKG